MSRVAPIIPEPVKIAARRHLSKAVRMALFASYDGLCAMCGCALPSTWELDHTIPLALGGPDEPHNWRPLCPRPCHLGKTAQDRKAIAKALRIIRQADPATRRKSPRPLRSRPFPKREMA